MINTTIITNSTEPVAVGLIQAVNTASDGVFGFGLLIACYLIVFFPLLNRWGASASFSVSAFVGAVFAILFRYLQIINDTILYGSIIILIIGVLILWFGRDSY